MSDLDIELSDIFSDGCVCIYRQRTDIPFTPENIIATETCFSSIARLNSAFSTSMAKVKNLAASYPLAWNPEFGYVTSRPDFCGTGLEISGLFHLEGLHLIGDLEPALNALDGLRMAVCGCGGDGIQNAAHLMRITNMHQIGIDERDIAARVGRIFSDLAHQESNARIRLVEELPRVFEDAIARSLAILRSCRMLSEWELLDIISPLRLAANLDFLDRFSRDEARALMLEKLNSPPTVKDSYEDQREKDRRDAAFADKANKRFKGVRLNALAREWLS